MVVNTEIKSGADIEILLGENYLQQIIQTFFDSNSIPPNLSIQGYRIDINPLTNLQLLDADDRDIQLDIPLDYFLPDGSQIPIAGNTTIDAKLNLNKSFTEDGNINELKIQIEVVDFGGTIQTAVNIANTQLPSNLQLTHQSVVALLNANLGQEYPLNIFGKDKQIRNMESVKYADNGQTSKAIGIYLNLRLQKGPEDFNVFENTIDLNEAVNFLPADQDVAFGIPNEMFSRISSDLKEGFAVESEAGGGNWSYPLKDGNKVIGKLRSIKILPYKTPIFNGISVTGFELQNSLQVILKGEIFVKEADIKPDFTVQIELKPNIVNGAIEWTSDLIDSDVDLSFWETLKLSFTFGFIIGWILSIFTGPIGLAVGGILTGIAAIIADPIADAIGEGIIEDIYKDYVDTSLFDAIPDRVTTITKRRDPFHETEYQVVSNFNHVLIDDDGFSMAGTASTGENYVPFDHVIIKNEIRGTNDSIQGFEIRVKDWNDIEEDILPTFERKHIQNKPELFYLSTNEIKSRKSDGRYSRKLQFNWPWEIDKKSNEIKHLKTISSVEKKEIENKHIKPHLSNRTQWYNDNLKEDTMAEIVEDMEKDLGRPLTDDDDKEKRRRFTEKLTEWLEEEEATFRRGGLKPLYKVDAEKAATLDLSPNEYGKLQQRGIMAMIYKYKRIRLKKTNTFYYRAKRNHTISDNLGEFKEYHSADVDVD